MSKNSKALFKCLSFVALFVAILVLTSCQNQVTLNEIKIESEPKTEYFVGEEFVVENLEVTGYYSDGTTKKVVEYEVDSSKVNHTVAGTYEVVVSYHSKSTSYNVQYTSDPVTSIKLEGQKVKFAVGEEFTTGELVVTIARAIRGEQVVSNYEIDSTGVNKEEAGTYEVVVSYEGVQATYEVVYELIVEGLKFELNEEKTGYIVSEIEGYEYPVHLVIPSEYKGLPVVEIGSMVSVEANYIKVPSTVTIVQESAFMGNQSIAIVDFTGCSVEIKAGAFYGSGVYAVELGNATKIGEEAFKDSLLKIINIPESVVEIGDNAFNTQTLNDVSFTGTTFPNLGQNVFGEKLSQEDYLYIYAQSAAWETIFASISEEAEDVEYEKAEIVKSYFGITYGAYLEMTSEQKEYVGLYTEDAIVYQIGGDYAVVVIEDYATIVPQYSYKGLSFVDEELGEEQNVFAFNKETKTVKKLAANEKGEYISGTILYEYKGSEVVYFVSEEVTEVIAGAGSSTYGEFVDTRFIVFGDNVTTIGASAFSFGQLFGVTFGKNVSSIGEAAFFQQEYLQEIIFLSEKAPEIGTGAFCYFGEIGLVPTAYMNGLAGYADCKIYIPRDTSTWFGDGYVSAYVEAFNNSLVGLEEIIVKDQNNVPVKYSSTEVKTQVNDDLYKFGNVFEFEYGRIYLRSVKNGYAYVELNEGVYDEVGSYAGMAYAYISDIIGYTGNESPKKIEIQFKTKEDEYSRKFTVYGKFSLSEKTFTLRGEEAGTYGEYPNEIVELDGFGNITYYNVEKGQYKGTYEISEGVGVVNGISVLTSFVYDSQTKTISFEEHNLPTIGQEAGVYFDQAFAAKIELDGTPQEVNDVKYNGTLKLTYNGEEYSSLYVIDGRKLLFKLGEVSKEWEYSKESTYVVKGYFDSNYNTYLEFKVVSSTGAKTYTNGEDTLVLDGFFNATINGVNYIYVAIEGTDVVVLHNEEAAIFVTLSGETYTVNTDPEAGVYYMDSSTNYRLYLAGNGALLYFNGDNAFGKYIYDEETGELQITHWNGAVNNVSEKGSLKEGFGYIVYDYWGATYSVISSQPIEKAYGNLITYVINEDETVSSSSSSYNVVLSGNNLTISKYGTAHQIIRLEEVVDGMTINVTVTAFEPVGLALKVTISHDETGKLVVSIVGPYESEIIESNGVQYMLNWVDEEHNYAGFYKIESYPTIVAGKVAWNEERTSFELGTGINISSGEYNAIVIRNYGSENVEASVETSSPMWYDSSTGPEYKYYKINIYSDSKLWVGNGNIAGASPEICDYTTTEVDGVTYYHFFSTATNMYVTFKLVKGGSVYFAVTEEVPA